MKEKLIVSELLGLPAEDSEEQASEEGLGAGEIGVVTFDTPLGFLHPEVAVESAVKLTPRISPIFEEPAGSSEMCDFITLKTLSKLGEIHVNDLITHATTGALAHPDGTLYHDIDSFTDCLTILYEQGRILPPSEEIVQQLFSCLDHGNEGKIGVLEVTTGLALFAGGSEDDKITAIFALVDANEDGFLSHYELVQFFTLIFQNVFTRDVIGAMAFHGVAAKSPEELAVRTAVECIEMCDLNKDGQLSLDEFRHWFSHPRIAPVL